MASNSTTTNTDFLFLSSGLFGQTLGVLAAVRTRPYTTLSQTHHNAATVPDRQRPAERGATGGTQQGQSLV